MPTLAYIFAVILNHLEDLFMKFAPNADDLWFWAMAVLKGTKIKITKNSYENFSKYAIFNKQNIENESLHETNIVQNDIQLKNILKFAQRGHMHITLF